MISITLLSDKGLFTSKMMQQSTVNCRGKKEFKNSQKLHSTDLHQEWRTFSISLSEKFQTCEKAFTYWKIKTHHLNAKDNGMEQQK